MLGLWGALVRLYELLLLLAPVVVVLLCWRRGGMTVTAAPVVVVRALIEPRCVVVCARFCRNAVTGRGMCWTALVLVLRLG